MKIVCNREKFWLAFQTASMVAPTRSPKPILQNVKFTASHSGSYLQATDTEVGIRLSVESVDVETEGAVVLPVARFSAILRETLDEQLLIETDGSNTHVRGNRSKFKIPAANPAEFPEVERFDASSYHEVPARLVRELVRRTLFATDTDSTRYALGGVLLEFLPEKIIAVGTDGRRLAKMEGPSQAIGGHESSASSTIVPARAMQLIERALQDGDAEIKLAGRANDLVLESPRATISARLVEGRFPKWQEVIRKPDDCHSLELSIGPFAAAVRQASIVTSQESRGIDFEFVNGTMILTGSTAEIGDSRIELPVNYDGDAIKISLDHRYVLDCLKVLDPEKTVTLQVVNNDFPAIFSMEDGYTYVVMPLTKEGR